MEYNVVNKCHQMKSFEVYYFVLWDLTFIIGGVDRVKSIHEQFTSSEGGIYEILWQPTKLSIDNFQKGLVMGAYFWTAKP